MVERGLLALKTGDPDECGWPNEPGLCMGLAGMGEVFVRAQRHETHFSKTETRKATGLKTGIHWIVNTYLCTCFFFFFFLHRISQCSPGWSGACGSRLPQNTETSSLLPPTLDYVGVCVLCLSLMPDHRALCFRKCPFSEWCEGCSQRAQRGLGRTAGLHFSIAELNRSDHEQ